MKLFQVLYRLTVPGGIILAMTFSLARLGVVAGVEGRRIHLYCAIIFAVALILSAVFRRSRLFLADDYDHHEFERLPDADVFAAVTQYLEVVS